MKIEVNYIKKSFNINHLFKYTEMDHLTNKNRIVPGNRHIKNCPVLDIEGRKQLADIVGECNFYFDQEFYKNFQGFIFQNPGHTTKELCEMITFYQFTEKTLDIAFRLFNTWKNTYYGVCGPFILKNSRWFPVYQKKYTDTVMLAQENSRLRQEVDELKNKISLLKTQLNVKL